MVPKRIASGTMYALEPGIEASLRIFHFDHADLLLTTKIHQRILFGDPGFGTAADFSTTLLTVGISAYGFPD